MSLAMPESGTFYRVQQPAYGGGFQVQAVSEGAETALPRPVQLTQVLPGELVRISQPADASGSAPLPPIQVVEASPARVVPGCIHFGVCGGCDYQHAAYTEQLALKQTILTGLLAGLTTESLPLPGLVSAEPWGYRNRIRLRVESVDGRLAAGYSVRGSNTFLPVRMCPIAAPLLWRAVDALLALGADGGSAGRWLQHVSQVELFTDGDQNRLQLTLLLRDPAHARNEPAAFPALCESLRQAIPQLAGAEAAIDPEAARRVRRAWSRQTPPDQTWGAPGLRYVVAGQAYWVSRGSFFQVNRLLVEQLVQHVVAEVPASLPGHLAWDLYAGVGLFSRPLAQRFERVIAVEGGDSGVADLQQNAREAAGRPRFTAIHAATLDFLRANEHQRERPDLVVLDPPRAGLGQEAAAILGRIGPARIVYVSCDPVSLPRDLAVLLDAGYRIVSLHLVDLFPQTFHLETVVHLKR